MIGLHGFTRPGAARRAAPDVRTAGKAWRADNPLEALGAEATVVFAVPLIGRDKALNWGIVERNLAATIRSLRAQTSDRWEALICGQDQPESIQFDDQVRFLKHTGPSAETGVSDKSKKLAQLTSHLETEWRGDGYLFLLDADDLLHPGLVDHCIAKADRSGYILAEGFMLDVANDSLAYLGENRLRFPGSGRFYSHCGSCAAIRMDLRSGTDFLVPLRDRGPHPKQANNLAAFGFQLIKIPFAAAIYVVNHSENLRARDGKMDIKNRYVDRNRLSPAREKWVRAEFGLQDLLGHG